jgi:tetratricopeptide (TPR) repeat protein
MKHQRGDGWITNVVIVTLTFVALTSTARAQAEEDQAPDAASSAPSDADRAAASEHFQRGVELHEEGDYDAALVEFQRAYEAWPDYRVLYNVGVTYLAQRSYVLSLRSFERYLVLGGSELSAERRAQVEERIANLRQRVGFLVLRTNVSGAEVSVDGEVAGHTPMDTPLPLDVGRHRIEVRAVGHQLVRRTVSVAGGDEVDLAIELEPVAAPVAAVPVVPEPALVPEPEPEHRNLRPLAVGGFITTAALAAAAGATGGLAFRSHRDYDDAAATYPGDAQAIADAHDRTKTLSLVTDVLGGAAIALGCTSLIVILVDRAHRRDDGENDRVELSLGPLGGSIRARF